MRHKRGFFVIITHRFVLALAVFAKLKSERLSFKGTGHPNCTNHLHTDIRSYVRHERGFFFITNSFLLLKLTVLFFLTKTLVVFAKLKRHGWCFLFNGKYHPNKM